MGVSAAILAPAALATVGAAAVSGGLQASEMRKARKQAERLAAEERARIEALQREAESPMPLADDEEVRRARRRSITSQMRRRGRQSTILTSDASGDRLGA